MLHLRRPHTDIIKKAMNDAPCLLDTDPIRFVCNSFSLFYTVMWHQILCVDTDYPYGMLNHD